MKTPLPVITRRQSRIEQQVKRNSKEREVFFKFMLPLFLIVCLWAVVTFSK